MEKKKAAEDPDVLSDIEEKPKEVEEEDESVKAAKEQKRSEALEKIPEEEEEHTGTKHASSDAAGGIKQGGSGSGFDTNCVEPASSEDSSYFPTKGPEVEEFLKNLKTESEKLKALQNAFTGIIVNEPINIEINKGANTGADVNYKVTFKTNEDIFNESSTLIENMFKYRPADFEGGEEEEEEEEDEEEEGAEGEEEEEEEEELDEDDVFDPTKKDENMNFGDTNHFCPISLSLKQTLVPGNPEFQCKYREKIYRFSSEENRALFMENPVKYLPAKKNPEVDYFNQKI